MVDERLPGPFRPRHAFYSGNHEFVLGAIWALANRAVIASRQDQAYDASSALAKEVEWDVEDDLPGDEGIFDWLLRLRGRLETRV